MNHDEFKALRNTIQNGAFTRHQLAQLLGESVGRICRWDEPEVEAVGHDLSEAHEALGVAIELIDERLSQREPRDPMAIARDAAVAEVAR